MAGGLRMDVYRSLLRPWLFRLPAETAHEAGRELLRAIGPLPYRRPPDDPRLAVRIGGLAAANPVGLAAGFDKDCECLDGLQRLGFGYLVAGTVMPAERRGNPTDRPRVLRLPETESLLNCLGLPSQGLAYAVDRLAVRRPGPAPVVVSVGGNTLADYLTCFEAVQPLADAVEINLRCPNARDDEGDFLRPAAFEQLMAELGRRKTRPLFVKLPTAGDPVGDGERLDLVERGLRLPIDAFTLPCTWTVADGRLSIGRGNLTGRAVFERALQTVRDVRAVTRGRLAVRARGGVSCGEDAYRAIAAGASAVDLYTAFVYQGWSVARRINAELLALMEARGVASVQALCGSDTAGRTAASA